MKSALAACLVISCITCWGAEVKVRSVLPRTVSRFEKCEIDVDVRGEWANPFDPDQINVSASFTTPSGKEMGLPVSGVGGRVNDSSCEELSQNGRNDD